MFDFYRAAACVPELRVGDVEFNKKQILEKCPDISTKTVERTLADLVKQGLIEKVGASSATSYVWVQKQHFIVEHTRKTPRRQSPSPDMAQNAEIV